MQVVQREGALFGIHRDIGALDTANAIGECRGDRAWRGQGVTGRIPNQGRGLHGHAADCMCARWETSLRAPQTAHFIVDNIPGQGIAAEGRPARRKRAAFNAAADRKKAAADAIRRVQQRDAERLLINCLSGLKRKQRAACGRKKQPVVNALHSYLAAILAERDALGFDAPANASACPPGDHRIGNAQTGRRRPKPRCSADQIGKWMVVSIKAQALGQDNGKDSRQRDQDALWAEPWNYPSGSTFQVNGVELAGRLEVRQPPRTLRV